MEPEYYVHFRPFLTFLKEDNTQKEVFPKYKPKNKDNPKNDDDLKNKDDNTSVNSVGKALEVNKILKFSFCWRSFPMLDRVNWGQKLLGSSYLCEESSHTKS